jgi:hypothetical protein
MRTLGGRFELASLISFSVEPSSTYIYFLVLFLFLFQRMRYRRTRHNVSVLSIVAHFLRVLLVFGRDSILHFVILNHIRRWPFYYSCSPVIRAIPCGKLCQKARNHPPKRSVGRIAQYQLLWLQIQRASLTLTSGALFRTYFLFVGFEVPTAMDTKNTILWDITLCRPSRVNRCFCSFATCFQAGFFLSLFFDPEDGGDMYLRNVGWLYTDYTMLYHRRWYSS